MPENFRPLPPELQSEKGIENRLAELEEKKRQRFEKENNK